MVRAIRAIKLVMVWIFFNETKKWKCFFWNSVWYILQTIWWQTIDWRMGSNMGIHLNRATKRYPNNQNWKRPANQRYQSNVRIQHINWITKHEQQIQRTYSSKCLAIKFDFQFAIPEKSLEFEKSNQNIFFFSHGTKIKLAVKRVSYHFYPRINYIAIQKRCIWCSHSNALRQNAWKAMAHRSN